MIRNICLVDTPYALSIYLLQMSMEDIKKTLFFVGDAVNINITKKLPHYVLVKNQSARDDWKYLSWLRISKYLKCWSYPFANLYIQDHLYIASQMIGPYQYTNLSDAPDCYSIWEESPYQPSRPKPTRKLSKVIKFLLTHGPMYDLKYGCNGQCINRWVTSIADMESKYIKGKNSQYIDAALLWKQADNQKRGFIKKVFGVSEDFSRRAIDTIILTQPLREDCKLTNEEMYAIYAPYINTRTNVAIKPHPRDKFDWKRCFPSVYMIDSYAPMQLLNYMGLRPKEAITVSSTAISAMPETTKKVFLGSKVHEKVFETLGDLYNA